MASSQSDSKIKKIGLHLISPLAIGLYMAVAMTFTAFLYYLKKDDIKSAGPILQLIQEADQISLDYRLKFRGPRPPHSDVAILAVDDRSLEIIGRWPWARDVMGRALDNAYKSGAKVIAADIVWSEPSDRPEVRLIENLNQKNPLPSTVRSALDETLKSSDPDQAFAEVLEKNKSQFVLGSFYASATKWQDTPLSMGYKQTCHDLIFKTHALQTLADKQAIPPVVIDSTEVLLPEEFALGYLDQFRAIEDGVRAGRPAPKTAFDRYQLENDVLSEKIKFCDKAFLDSKTDEIAQNLEANWDVLREAVSGLSFSSYAEWLADFRSRSYLNAVPETLFWTLNLPDFNSRSDHFGYFNAELDSDGTIRRSQLISRTGSKYFPSISLQAYLVATGQNVEVHIGPHDKPPGLKAVKHISVMNNEGEEAFRIPTTAEGSMVINYTGRGKNVPHASIADLLNENDPNILVTRRVNVAGRGWIDEETRVPKKEFFKNKILVLGATAVGVYDLRVTPFDENFPGVETHANVIDNLLSRNFLARNANEDLYMPAFLLVVGILAAFSLAHTGALPGMVFTIALVLLVALTDRYLLFSKGHLVSITLPIFQAIGTYVIMTFYKYLTEERSKKELRATFSKYVSPAIVEEILQDPKNLELGGRKETVTVFFSDVRGFTTISEKLDPRALSDLLNSYLTPMTELVFKNQGTLDKYMGDAIMAFFGAPVHYPNHAQMACRCALQHLQALKVLQAEYEKKGLPQIDIGIGLNTGECSVGNMGSQTVRSYTVMGDAVNLASRLEGINKTYGTHVIISEFTYEQVKNDFVCREVDWVRVKGKLKPVKIYELIAEGAPSGATAQMVQNFSSGYERYHARQFAEAVRLFEAALAANPEDETSKIYIERCNEFLAEPPPSEWDGVYVMKTK